MGRYGGRQGTIVVIHGSVVAQWTSLSTCAPTCHRLFEAYAELMFNESVILASIGELQRILIKEVSIFHVALVYVLMYVVYKALGRYIYFKPQEHASKVNRTFLTLAVLVVLVHVLSGVTKVLPFSPEYRWLYMLCGLILLVAPLSIIMDWIIWRRDSDGHKFSRVWHNYYLPIQEDYYKTSRTRSVGDGNILNSYEEEGVKSTNKNIHSDALLNVLALFIFVAVCGDWAYDSALRYGVWSFIISSLVALPIAGLFVDQGVFSWIRYLERNRGKK